MTLRTDDLTLDKDFTVRGAVTKTWVAEDGSRYIQGVISGVDEDRDGERVSEDCIKSMVSQVRTGKVVATASHKQDWFTTFGEATEAFHDAETGEMVGKVRLPPEGLDPVADKAWLVTKRGGLGWSIGGKLQRAFFEKTEVGKKRKVLDQVALKHFCLTDQPAYAASFAEVVAKEFDGDDADLVYKTDTGVAGEPGGDSKTGDRNAGTSSGDNRLKTDEPEKDDTDEKGKLPKSPRGGISPAPTAATSSQPTCPPIATRAPRKRTSMTTRAIPTTSRRTRPPRRHRCSARKPSMSCVCWLGTWQRPTRTPIPTRRSPRPRPTTTASSPRRSSNSTRMSRT